MKDEKLTERIQIMLSKEQLDLVKRAASSHYLSVSAWIRTSILIGIQVDRKLEVLKLEDLDE